jgi:flagellar protein FliT
MRLILRKGVCRGARNPAVRRVRQIPTGAPNGANAGLLHQRSELTGVSQATQSMAPGVKQYACRHEKSNCETHDWPPMPTMPLTLLDCYRAIEDGSLRMLAAAHAGEWQRVAELEGDCAMLIARLKQRADQTNQAPALKPLERQEKQRILQRILGVDAQIRCLAEPQAPWADAPPEWPANPVPKVLH